MVLTSVNNDFSYLEQLKSSLKKFSFFNHIEILILRINCFATLGDKKENKLRKANFTLNIYDIILLKIR